MLEIHDDIWKYHSFGYTICITTNGSINRYGAYVMGRGVALQAKQRFPQLPYQIAYALNQYGNIPVYSPDNRIITFPVKHRWMEKANLILESSKRLVNLQAKIGYLLSGQKRTAAGFFIYLPRPGCANGQRD